MVFMKMFLLCRKKLFSPKKLIFFLIISSLASLYFYSNLLSKYFNGTSYNIQYFNYFKIDIFKNGLNDNDITQKAYYEAENFELETTDNEINNETFCNLPDLNEWHPKIKKYFKALPVYNNCTKSEPLTYVRNNILYINNTVNQTFYKGEIGRCLAAKVIRETSRNDNIAYGEFEDILNNTLLEDEIIMVRCISNKDLPKQNRLPKGKKAKQLKVYENRLVLYEYVHFQILGKEREATFDKTKDKINVMMLMFDGVSLSSMKRALPKTLQYLKSFEEFFLFEKHHVTGENTFQNLVPMLTNLESEVLLQKRDRKNVTLPFDEYPFIWKNFSER